MQLPTKKKIGHVLPTGTERRAFLRHVVLWGTAGVIAACGTQPTATPAATVAAPSDQAGKATESSVPTVAASGDTPLLRASIDIPVKLDPAAASTDAEIAILNAVYDYLVDIDANSKIQPRLATAWTVSADGLSYTFTLASNVLFHDGTPLTAKDVVWTFDRLRDPAIGLSTSDVYSNVTGIIANGDHEVVFTLNQTNPFFLYDVSDNHALILKAGTTDADTKLNGTGPFKVTSYSPENRMELVANEHYFVKGRPGVANLQFIFFKDQTAGVDALRGGQIDLITRMPTALFQTLEQDPAIRAFSIPTNGFDLIRLRTDRKPGNDPRVIRALKLATDRQAIFETANLSLGTVGRDSPIGPLFKSYYSEATAIAARDPVTAKALLTEAGYPDGLKLDLHTPDSGDRPDLAVILKEQWAEAGIELNVIVMPESVYYGENGWLDVDLGITSWGSRPTPQFYLDVMLITGAKWNESHFSDPELDDLAKLAGSTQDEAARIQAYAAIQRLLIERGPLVVPYFFAQLGALSSRFDGFTMKAFAGRSDIAGIRAIA